LPDQGGIFQRVIKVFDKLLPARFGMPLPCPQLKMVDGNSPGRRQEHLKKSEKR
jgi:hypothetical protein